MNMPITQVPGNTAKHRTAAFRRCGLLSVLLAGCTLATQAAELDRSDWTVLNAIGNNPANAYDIDIESRWTTETAQAPGQMFTLDLGAEQMLDRLVLVTNNNHANNQDFPRAYVVHLSSDAQSWGSAVATGQGSADHTTVIDFERQTARYVRITQTGSTDFHWWSIHDLRAFDNAGGSQQQTSTPTDAGPLSRKGWKLSASSNSGNADKAVDIFLSSRWTTAQPQQPGQFFMIDMRSSQLIDRVLLKTNHNDVFNLDHPRGYEVHLSSDGMTWGAAVASGIGSDTGTTDIRFTRQPARYIRLTQTGGDAFYWWSIHDVAVYGSSNPATANTAPAVSFLSPTPADKQTLSSSEGIVIAVDAADSDGFLNSVSLYLNDQLIGARELPPYEWDAQTDSLLNNLSEGTYQLRVEAIDNLGAVGSAEASFTISASTITTGELHPDIVTVLMRPLSDIPYAPDAQWWGDSYSVGNQCFCDTTFDHDIDIVEVDTPFGTMTVRDACGLLGPGPGSDGRPKYNDVQCGNGPVNGTVDEDFCPGQVNATGTDEQRRLACNNIGPVWNFDAINAPPEDGAPRHPDIVRVLDTPLSDIPYGPDAQWWGDSYSVGDQCYCDTTFDHGIGDVNVDTPLGVMTVREACGMVGEGPGSEGRPKYNDVQCGNGPVNGTQDESFCPGQVNVEGTQDERRLGCNNIGPTWKF